MAHKIVIGGFALGVLILAVGLFVAPLAGDTQTDARTVVELADGGDRVDVTQRLGANATINDTTRNATITVTNTQTFDSANTTLQEGDNTTLTVQGENVSVSYETYNGNAVVRFDYPPTYGYNDETKLFFENLGLLLTLIGFAIVVAVAFYGVRVA